MRLAPKMIYLQWRRITDWFTSLRFKVQKVERRKRLALAGVLCGTLCLFGLVGSARASAAGVVDTVAFFLPGGQIGALFFTILAALLGMIISLLMTLDGLITLFVIAIAQYNNFVSADVVTKGWPLVRDVCNMFFIVVLLVIAFSTIIGYKEFEYKRYVPRLLLMAVLINFSKTLVGLMIDFSQVVMLTFVNGFKDAAFGNFVRMFGMDKIMTIYKSGLSSGYSAMVAQSGSLIIADLFGILMLGLVGTLLVIMLIYLVARVVSLWIILIFSPLAFFIWSLPPKLQKIVAAFSSDWWQQLASWLAGGPLMAFFLWLTLAIFASSDTPFASVMPKSAEMGYFQAAITAAAEPAQVARFIVAVTLLFIGIKSSIKVASQASQSLGKAAEKISGAGGPAGLLARAGGYVGGKAAKTGVRMADQRFGISQKMGKSLAEHGAQMASKPGAGMLGQMMGNKFMTAGRQVASYGGNRQTETAKTTAENAKMLKPEQQHAYFSSLQASTNKDMRFAGKKGMIEALDREDFSSADIKKRTEAYESGGKGKDEAKALAAADFKRDKAQFYGASMADPEVKGDGDLMKLMKDKIKEDPSLNYDLDKYKAAVQKMPLGKLPDSAVEKLDGTVAVLEELGLIKGDEVDPNWRDNSALKKKLAGGGAFARNFNAGMAYLQDPAMGKAAIGLYNKGQSTNIGVAPGSNGGMIYYNSADKSTVTRGKNADTEELLANAGMRQAQIPEAVNRFGGVSGNTQAAAISNAYSSGAYNPAATSFTPDQASAMAGVQIAGGSSSAAFGINNKGGYESPAYAGAHGAAISSAAADLSSPDEDIVRRAVNVISSTDSSVIESGGQASEAVIDSLKGKLDELVIQTDDHAPAAAPKVEVVVKAVAKLGLQAQTKANAKVALNSAEKKAKEVLEKEIMKDAVLRKKAGLS